MERYNRIQLADLLSDIYEKDIYEQSKLAYSLAIFIEQGEVDANKFLLATIDTLRTGDNLYMVGIALRYGASPNLYVKTSDDRQKHFIIFVIDSLKNAQVQKGLLEFTLGLIIKSGGDINAPAYMHAPRPNIDSGLIESQEKISMTLGKYEKDVYNYALNEQMINLKNIVLTDLQRSALDLFLDIPKQNQSFDFEDVIRARAFKVFKASKKLDIPLGGYNFYYHGAVKSVSLPIVRDLLEIGFYPTYFDINLMISELIEEELDDIYRMILESINYGVSFDTFQFKSLQKAGDPTYTSLLVRNYTNPYILKVMNSKIGLIPQRLSRFAFDFSISLEKSKSDIIDSLLEIYNTSKEKIVDTFKERRDLMIAALFTPFLEFYKPIRSIVSSNESLQPVNLLNDYQGITFESDGNYYSYTSPMFKSLLVDNNIRSSKTGDYIKVPEMTKVEIAKNLKVLEIYDINPDDFRTVDEAFDVLHQDDKINDHAAIMMMNTAKLVLKDKYFDPTIVESKSDAFPQILDAMDMSMPEIVDLEISHQISTFYTACYYFIKNGNSVEELKEIIMRIIYRM